MQRAAAAVAAALLIVPDPSAAQARPEARAHHDLVHHAGEDRVLLIGGSTRRDSGYHWFDDVWAWDGNDWQPRDPLPFPRSSHRVVHDRSRDRIVLFGGGFEHAVRTDPVIWELGTAGWRAAGGAVDAGASEPGLCYDASRRRVVAFGGWDADNAFRGDTWEWDGEDLARVDSAGPAPRAGHAFLFDPVRGTCLLFGGRGTAGYLDDTWEWDGMEWRRIDVPGPSPRWFFGAAPDLPNGRIVIFGGRGPAAPIIGRDETGDLGDTWSWDGREWRRLAVEGPPARSGARMAFTGTAILLFGGRTERPDDFHDHDDTWELRGSEWIRHR